MKKEIQIEEIPLKSKRYTSFKIIKQTHKCGKFGNKDCDNTSFKASNGMELNSYNMPEYNINCKNRLWVRGKDKYRDDEIITVTKLRFAKIQQAIKKYNEFYSDKETKTNNSHIPKSLHSMANPVYPEIMNNSEYYYYYIEINSYKLGLVYLKSENLRYRDSSKSNVLFLYDVEAGVRYWNTQNIKDAYKFTNFKQALTIYNFLKSKMIKDKISMYKVSETVEKVM